MGKNILVLPDIHGRTFWKEPCKHIEDYEKVIFLGDYLDPYDFENISVQDAISNFREIVEFKKKNAEKVILLLGNHDMPYFSDEYYRFSIGHCRHSRTFHKEIADIFNEAKRLFGIAYVYEDILFTHAGVTYEWLSNVVKCEDTNINKICSILNELIQSREGQIKLFYITSQRGGRDRYASCVWADIDDMMWDYEANSEKEIHKIKQIFGHTMQAFYDTNRNIVFGDSIEFGNCKMLDTAKPYVLNASSFETKIAEY